MQKQISRYDSLKCRQLGWADLTRAIVLLIALGVSARPIPTHAHPHGPFEIATHEHPALGLIISIKSDGVVYDISLSNGFLNTLIPQERGHLKLRLEENTFIFMDPAQEAAERQSLSDYFSQLPHLKINDEDCKPQFESFEFVRSSSSADIKESETLPPDARVRVTFAASDQPQHVGLFWNVFTDTYSVDAFGDPVKPELAARLDTRTQSRIVTFTRESPSIEWQAPKAQTNMSVAVETIDDGQSTWRIPLLSTVICLLGLAGCWMCRRSRRPWRARSVVFLIAAVAAFQLRDVGGYTLGSASEPATVEPFPKVASDVFDALLKNIYRAFDFRNESDIYDVLAQSVDGPLLDAVYKEIQSGLVSAEQGGAIAKVKSVAILDSQLIDSSQTGNQPFDIRGQWRVEGMVYHWGHVHDTSSIFEAIYTVAPRDGFWKIVKTDMKSAAPES
ncbi:MAG: hypothetical protein DHS20C16_00860 [Phycisphaerae bacterium]|nr:MAG: hypothetical protein DHS20C16_00860 [Phycisphaerae bacterium]